MSLYSLFIQFASGNLCRIHNAKFYLINLFICLIYKSIDVQPPPSTQFPDGLHKFLNFEEYLVFIDVRDSGNLKPVSNNADKYVSVYTCHGVRQASINI